MCIRDSLYTVCGKVDPKLNYYKLQMLLARPPDVVVGVGLICFTTIRQIPSELTERKSTKTCRMLGSECDLKMHVPKFGVSRPTKVGAPNLLFSTSQINGNLNGEYHRKEIRHRQPGNGVRNQEGSCTSSKKFRDFRPQTPKNRN